jgi:hypothetical protein
MLIHTPITMAIVLAFAVPAAADCSGELKTLEQAVVSAETGASPNASGLPATEHQEQVLPGKQNNTDSSITGSTAVSPTSPHQEQVTGMGERQPEHASQLFAEARKLSESGDEAGCMQKVTQLKDMLGVK